MIDEFESWMSSLLQQGYSLENEVNILLTTPQNPQDQLRQLGINPLPIHNFSLEDSMSQQPEQESSPLKKARQILAQSTQIKIEQEILQHQMNNQNKHTHKSKNIIKRRKLTKTKAEVDYKKNIPNYITKTCLNHMFTDLHKKRVQKLCKQQGIEIEQLKDRMKTLAQTKMIGLGELSKVLQTDSGVNQVFHKYFTWFLRRRYMIFLLEKGKMLCKEQYISRKNDLLFLDCANPQYH